MVSHDQRALRFPYRDAFGSVVTIDDLKTAVLKSGLDVANLILGDTGVRIEHQDSVSDEVLAKALTQLRGLLSPLCPCHSQISVTALSGLTVIDERHVQPKSVFLAEVSAAQNDLEAIVRDLRSRAGVTGPVGLLAARSDSGGPNLSAQLEKAFIATATANQPSLTCAYSENPRTSGVPEGNGLDLFLLVFQKLTGNGLVMALSDDVDAIDWFRRAVLGQFDARGAQEPIILDGLEWEIGRRPIIAALASTPESLLFDRSVCETCGTCGQADLAHLRVDRSGVNEVQGELDPSQRYDLIELCPNDAIRPRYSKRSATFTHTLLHRPQWLARLLGDSGPSFPSARAPSYIRAKKADAGPRYVLGLAVMTMQEHAAVLLKDGEIVGAIEEERASRIRHHGWRAPGRPSFVTAAVDPTICIEEVFCYRSIRMLLEAEGITLDDIELIAFNGLHGRYRNLFSRTEDGAMPIVKTGRLVYVPHHLCHAASTYRVSGLEKAWVFTVDGRGDRETAALFRAEGKNLTPQSSILSLSDTSIGGLYESATRLLGFGSHGQGSFMALASFAPPSVDVSAYLSVDKEGELTCHESGFTEEFSEYERVFEGPIETKHYALAASVQDALESSVEGLLRAGGVTQGTDGICLAGGVTLNCQMNDRLRRRFSPDGIFVQPGANDAGTALGAALEAWSHFGQGSHPTMEHAYLGPEFSDDAIEEVLKRSGLRYRRSKNVAKDVAKRLADGEIFCFFQHRMEFGPRALGARSIIADPRSTEVKDKANALKTRQSWRPFGPSILAGHEQDYFEEAFDTRFMLFTQRIKADKLSELSAVAHVDGTTRPQVVHPEPNRAYHALISEFYALTGVPMVLNTSFNRRGEPIVCSPSDAVTSFVGLGADALAIGSFIVERAPENQELPDLRTQHQPWWKPLGDEALFLSANETVHDSFVGEAGHWRRTFSQLQVQPGKGATILLIAGQMAGLGSLIKNLLRARVKDLIFRFPKAELTVQGQVVAGHVPTLEKASDWVSRVAPPLKARGIKVSIQMIPAEQLPSTLGEDIIALPATDGANSRSVAGTWKIYTELMGR